jgi:hypothetical protein
MTTGYWWSTHDILETRDHPEVYSSRPFALLIEL